MFALARLMSYFLRNPPAPSSKITVLSIILTAHSLPSHLQSAAPDMSNKTLASRCILKADLNEEEITELYRRLRDLEDFVKDVCWHKVYRQGAMITALKDEPKQLSSTVDSLLYEKADSGKHKEHAPYNPDPCSKYPVIPEARRSEVTKAEGPSTSSHHQVQRISKPDRTSSIAIRAGIPSSDQNSENRPQSVRFG